ncbi:hypothetical protein DFH09DRAFT_1084445 [Mycena vulgaris]|nr:hypothetical protein DFH09DRAFT_1084445 [Mycena vulgaris]
MCPIRGGLNLSYECMTSFDTNERLIRLRTENPDLWNDFQTKSTRQYCPGDDEEVAEDLESHEDEEMGADDSEIPTREVIRHVVAKKTGKNRRVKTKTAAVGLASSGEAEDADAEVAATDDMPIGADVPAGVSGKRIRRANLKYTDFWRHANDKDEDLDVPGLKYTVAMLSTLEELEVFRWCGVNGTTHWDASSSPSIQQRARTTRLGPASNARRRVMAKVTWTSTFPIEQSLPDWRRQLPNLDRR